MTGELDWGRCRPDEVVLPAPRLSGGVSIEEALCKRRSQREYSSEPLALHDVSQLLWAVQGITGPFGLRTAPSAGALFPLEIYLLPASVEALPNGLYKYRPFGHKLQFIREGDLRGELYLAALSQECIKCAAALIVISYVYERTTTKYGERGNRYVHMEAGHAAQNAYLEAASMGLGTVVIGAFDDSRVRLVMGMGDEEQPLCIMPIGKL
jgi:SagB-type dehydrogenase family enzyme